MLQLPSKECIEVCVDEVGRGTLMGNVVAAAVIWPSDVDPEDKMMLQINDSKKITPKKRAILEKYIKNNCVAYGIGEATVEEIDKFNILKATHIAMHRALDMVYSKNKFDAILVDGDKFKPYMCPDQNSEITVIPHECIEGGDSKVLGIAAASILAKEYRDNYVKNIVKEHPELDEKYGWFSNKGYGTKKHMDGLKQFGASSYHRKTFAPVARVL